MFRRTWLILLVVCMSWACAQGGKQVDDDDGVSQHDSTTSTSSTSSGGSTCDSQVVDDIGSATCDSCSDCALPTVCAAPLAACQNSVDCLDFADCLDFCAGDSACVDECSYSYPTGNDLYLDLASCVYCQACSNNCDANSNCS